MDTLYCFEMSISREEFFRLLPAAVGPYIVDGDTIRSPERHHGWMIRLVPLANHRVGSVTVQRHRIEIVLEACSEAEGAAFLERFHRAFLRGGG
jgi:hypothetical protein